MVEAYMYVWHGMLPSFPPFWVIFLLWKAQNICPRLFPQALFLSRHHTRQYSVEVPSTFPKNGIVFFSFSLFHDVPNAPVFSFFITGLEGLHGSEALKRFLNIHWRMCNYGFENKKQVQKQSGAKQGLKCDGRHTAAHMLFKMIHYSSADFLFADLFLENMLFAVYLAVQLSWARYGVKPSSRCDNISITEEKHCKLLNIQWVLKVWEKIAKTIYIYFFEMR